MFDVGFWELLLIGVVGLLVVGPERLPEFARTIGRWVGQAQRMMRSVRADIERELETDDLRNMINQQEEQIKELKDMVQDVRDETETEVGADTLSNEFARMQDTLQSDVGSAGEADSAGHATAQTPSAALDSGAPQTAEVEATSEADAKKP